MTINRYALAALLGALAMLGPFSIDTYLPAFAGIGTALQVTPAQMQQTLSVYLIGFAVMMLFHGALSDSFGRKPIILVGLIAFSLASVGCALADNLPMLLLFRTLQGMAAGAGMTVGRAVIRDLFNDTDAQKVMSVSTLVFGISPALAPLIGGIIYAHLSWHWIFWFLAVLGAALAIWTALSLPETLPPENRQAFSPRPLLQGYKSVAGNLRFFLLALASSIPFNGFFVYVLSAPVFLGELLHLAPTQFYWFFIGAISGIMGGAAASGRLAGLIQQRTQVKIGFVIMMAMAALNVFYTQWFTPSVPWIFVPIAIFAFGWSLVVPIVSIMVLNLFPERRGMASSLQGAVSSFGNAIVAGVVSPLVMHSTRSLALAALVLAVIGMLSWWGAERLAAPVR